MCSCVQQDMHGASPGQEVALRCRPGFAPQVLLHAAGHWLTWCCASAPNQDWLWCETWCGNATKATAKTIDLCNNPLTKEPKLEGARRIVAEWPGLDEEVSRFTAQVGMRLIWRHLFPTIWRAAQAFMHLPLQRGHLCLPRAMQVSFHAMGA
jgi:hypothetical protein